MSADVRTGWGSLGLGEPQPFCILLLYIVNAIYTLRDAQRTLMTTKIRKHQPNAASLIHNFCNGANVAMVTKASVSCLPDHPSEGDSSLYSYRTRIAVRHQHNGRTWFLYNCRDYSVTTSRHQGRFVHSVPMSLPSINKPEGPSEDWFMKWKDDKKGMFRVLDEELKADLKDNSYRVIFYDHKGHIGFGIGAFTDDAWYLRGEREEIETSVSRIEKRKPRTAQKFRWAFDDLLHSYRRGQLLAVYAKEFAPSQLKDAKKFLVSLRKKICLTWDKMLVCWERVRQGMEKRNEELRRKFRAMLPTIKRWHDILTEANVAALVEWRKGNDAYKNTPERLAACETIREELTAAPFPDLVSIRNAAALIPEDEFRRTFGDLTPTELMPVFVSSVTALRVRGDVIQTTRGAEVPLSLAALVWKANRDTFRRAAETKESVRFSQPVRVGLFTMDRIEYGVVCIGCHRIDAGEIVRLADGLGWE